MLILRLLGPIDIRADERVVRYNGRDKGLTLLAYLATTAGHTHTREDVADLFWPDLSHERARQNLRQTLLRLRQLLADANAARPCLPNRKYSILFDPHADHWADLKAFGAPVTGDESIEQLQQRAALYRGDFMADFAGGISERFDDWVAERRTEYRNAALVLESKLAAGLEQTGQIDQAIEHARRCTRLEPWNETGQRQLLRLLARAGHPAAALSHFDAWREDLRRELGTDVQAETLLLVERIRAGAVAPADAGRKSPPTERRQVTVLDCGLACEDDDPETIALTLSEPQRLVQAIVKRHGGWVAMPQPGRVTAYFGWPEADELAAAHAADAALTVLKQLPEGHPGVRLAIGIDHAPMLVSHDESGGWLAAERALRLRLSAPSGAALVGGAMAGSLAERFHLDRHEGTGDGTDAWRLTGERRSGAPDRAENFPLTGRTAELERITEFWRQARAAGPRVLAVVGPAGIGKSRLAREFLRSNDLDETRAYWCECDPLHVDSPLFPLQRMLQRVLGLAPDADEAAVRARLGTRVPDDRDGETMHRLVPLFCSNLRDVEAPDADAGLQVPLVSALTRLLARVLATAGPGAILVLEDAHWADASTLEALDALARCEGENVLILLLAREPPLLERFEQLTLAPLDRSASAALAKLTAGAKSSSAVATEAAEGIPLFIIELARMHRTMHSGSETVPSNLRDLLAARLAQAGADKVLLQAAAVIGRTFETRALRSLADEPTGPLDDALQRLVGLNLLERTPEGARFTHALLQRAAYDSLPRMQRIALHRRLAEWIQADAPAAARSAPEKVAWHLSAAGLDAEAARWWLAAAQRASRLSAYAETAQFAERSLTAIEAAPERVTCMETELGALLVGAYARVALGGYFDPAAQALHKRARDLLEGQPADAVQVFGILRGYWIGASSRASYHEARAIAEEMAVVADTANVDALRGVAHYLVGNSALWLGEFADAFAHLDRAVRLLQRTVPEPVAMLAHDQDFEATALGYLAWAHWHLGRTDDALELGRRAMELARARRHLLTLMHTATSFCSIAMGSNRAEEVSEVAAQTIRMAEANHLAMWADIGRLQQNWAYSALGRRVDTTAATQVLERVCAMYPGGAAGFQIVAAEMYLALGEHRQARTVLLALRRSIRSTKAGIFVVPRLLMESRLAREQGRRTRATSAGRRALALARAQGSPQLEALAREALRTLRQDAAGRRARPRATAIDQSSAVASPGD